jgi:predicted transport protein
MPLFQREKQKLELIKPKKFLNEKELQGLIESNLDEMFNCRFVSTEFSTGPVHGGRIDTLALSEENNPVIIEYKVVESSQLVNQSLYYLSWINDHRGDYALAVQQEFPNGKIVIDWSDIRVICIAPEYKKYDLHAVKMMGSNIELWQYRYYESGALFLEEIYKKSIVISSDGTDDYSMNKNPVMVEAGKKAALTRATGIYTLKQHFNKIEKSKEHIATNLQDYILGLDESIEEAPKKFYIAFKVSQNFVCMEIHKNKILLYLKIDPAKVTEYPENCRDVSEIGHYGTGDFEVTVTNEEDLSIAKKYITIAFNNIGGN